jgi:hypothetical protein
MEMKYHSRKQLQLMAVVVAIGMSIGISQWAVAQTTPSQLNFNSSGAPKQFVYTGIYSHIQSVGGGWFQIIYNEIGPNNELGVSIQCDPNTGSQDRQGSIIINYTNQPSVEVRIYQQGSCPLPAPPPPFAGEYNYCKNSPAKLNVNRSSDGVTSYEWEITNGYILSYEGSDRIIANVQFLGAASSTAIIKVRSVTTCGRSDYTQKTVTLKDVPTGAITASVDLVTCSTPVARLTAPAGSQYLWNTNSFSNYVDVSPNTQTTYTVVVKTAENCSATFSKIVNADKPMPDATITASLLSVTCTNQTATLSAANVYGNTYEWSTGQTGSSIQVSPTETESYSLVVTGTNGCSASTAVTVESEKNMTKIVSQPVDVFTIVGSSVTFKVNAQGEDLTYKWYRKIGAGAFELISPTTAMISVASLSTSDNNSYYKCVVTGKCNSVESIPAKLTVSTDPASGQIAYAAPKPSSDENYVLESSINVPLYQHEYEAALSGDQTLIAQKNIQVGDIEHTVSYMDGLGRNSQTNNYRNSPHANDVVEINAFDQYGRETTKYLPYSQQNANSDGMYRQEGITEQEQFYNDNSSRVAVDGAPYAKTVFENSPLNRVVKEGAPGIDWQPGTDDSDHTIKHRYRFNFANEVVLFVFEESTEKVTHLENGLTKYYAVNQLQAHHTIDANQHETVEFTDKDGNTVLIRQQRNEGPSKLWAETYYVYDTYKNLVMILPPEAIKNILQPQP